MELESVLEKTVSYEFGLFTSLSEIPVREQNLPFHIFVVDHQRPQNLLKERPANIEQNRTQQTTGSALTREDAIWAAIGEGIERYSASNWFHLEPMVTDGESLTGAREFLERSIFYREEEYSAQNFNFIRPDPKTKLHWLEGRSLVDDKPFHVPMAASSLFIDARFGQELLDRGYSTGLASHTKRSNAIYAGLCEVVERDAFLSYWLTKSIPPRLSSDALNELLPRWMLEYMNQQNFEYGVFALPTDLEVPIIACCIKLPDGGIAKGACCNLSCSKATIKAVTESIHTKKWCEDIKRVETPVKDKNKINDFKDHVSYYLNKEISDRYPWLYEAADVINSTPDEWLQCNEDVDVQLSKLVARISDKGFHPVSVDLTSPDIREIGFFVEKTFVPGLQPLSAGYKYVQTDPRRLNQFAEYRNIEWAGQISFDPPHAFP